jgi:hypothetical protein
MDVWFCVTRRNRAERHNREVMNTLSETTRRSPERYGKALPHLTKTYMDVGFSYKWLVGANQSTQGRSLTGSFVFCYWTFLALREILGNEQVSENK